MRNIIKNKTLSTDTYVEWLGGELPMPEAHQDVVVSLETLLANQQALLNRDGKLAIKVPGETEPEAFAGFLPHLAMVAIVFPKFSDGRGYSLARLLRDRYKYKGEVRAVGDVLRDQLFFMHRVGFDAFDIREDRCATDALQAFADFTVTYQGDVHEARPIYHRRPH